MRRTTGNADHAVTRREFLRRGVALTSFASTALYADRSVGAIPLLEDSHAGKGSAPEDRVLVIVELRGGNDGLNTVVPYGVDEYNKLRPHIAVPAPNTTDNPQDSALRLDDAGEIGLHPAFSSFKDLLDDGYASIVQGVGRPDPARSHSASMRIWHTAGATSGGGWIGRFLDLAYGDAPDVEAAVVIGRTAPLAMIGDIHKPVTFESADIFRWVGEDLHQALREPYDQINRSAALNDVDSNSQLGFLMRTSRDTQFVSDRIRSAVAQRPLVGYPDGPLGRKLQHVAMLIRAGLRTRVYYVSLSGFDTHADQPPRHAELLRQLGDSLKAFHIDLRAQGNSGRVLAMIFSEFGRRVTQNASGGTDHGAAAPMFFIGDKVRPGLLGEHPSLTNLTQGDLIFTVDFRCLYAAVLEDWLGANSAAVLGRKYRKASIIEA